MKLPKNLFSLILVAFISACSVAPTTSYGRQERSQIAKNEFKAQHPCPSNGRNHGPCPGYVIDHITPLACSGDDAPNNMQWQSVTEGKIKDKWERKDCQTSSLKGYSYFRKSSYSSDSPSPSLSTNDYNRGPRGGCFVYTANGKKRYVNHSNCH